MDTSPMRTSTAPAISALIGRTRRPSARASGFTVIELLVVVGVISLLVAILVPAVARARRAARAASCLSNQKQIGVAVGRYGVSEDGFFVPGEPDWGDPGSVAGLSLDHGADGMWHHLLWDGHLSRKARVLRDPALERGALFDPFDDVFGGKLERVSYVMNNIEVGSWAPATLTPYSTARSHGYVRCDASAACNSTAPLRTARVTDPAAAVAMACSDPRADGGLTSSDARGVDRLSETDRGAVNPASGPDRDVGWAHGAGPPEGGFNAVFGDGHAAFVARSRPLEWAARRVE